MDQALQEVKELSTELDQLKSQHSKYTKVIDDVKELQKKCLSGIGHQRYRMKQIGEDLKRLSSTGDEGTKQKATTALQEFAKTKTQILEMQETLPRKNGLYLNIVLGQVNVSLLNKKDKFEYKQSYEQFKLIVTIVSIILSIILYFWVTSRVVDAVYNFLLLWYYCTLTIREHILITNGSRIKGWWLLHHFITTFAAGILLIWPKAPSYDAFRDQFMLFSLYLNLVQFLQYYYQRGCLYKLRALGQSHNMDITVDGFMSWMSLNLSFILPFLFAAYFFQLYNAYTLFHISMEPYCKEWQVPVLAVIFFVLFSGNFYTTLIVVRQKIMLYYSQRKERLQTKYQFSAANNDTKKAS